MRSGVRDWCGGQYWSTCSQSRNKIMRISGISSFRGSPRRYVVVKCLLIETKETKQI